MKPRFLLDEHIDLSIQRQLRRLDPHVDVIAIGESGYILITENRSTIPDHLKEHYAAGLICPACSGFGRKRRLAELLKNCI